MNSYKNFVLVTDIGSTTTKAILVDINTSKLLGIEHADTTVEAPQNDVRMGVYKATKKLQEKSGIAIMMPESTPEELLFNPEVGYLSTSSAGGGLQILVIGLTLFDSASSAKRAAYGAGGVILDVFAIDDKRTAVEQMLSMRNLRPDMILLCGGTDGGAISSVLRMAEILRIARPMPKFSTNTKIPAIYAGNQDATDLIKKMIGRDFDLHILPNLRPSLSKENLKPSQDKIQELFMEHVMERAPGYGKLKSKVFSGIIPTPKGVLQTMNLMQADDKNIIMFDIGGATTDVFTRINGHFQRTVSANMGMSYSALNVMKESGVEVIQKLLPSHISETRLRNYIGNKTLYPLTDPSSCDDFRMEHALAICAMNQAFFQHQQMHYNTQKVGFLDALKLGEHDQYEEKFEYVENEAKYYFYPSDINIVIGAGGVFAHAQNTNQCLNMLIGGFHPSGISELAIDKYFISPHLGILAGSERSLAEKLLKSDGIRTLAIYIRPFFPNKSSVSVLEGIVNGKEHLTVVSDQFIVLKGGQQRKIALKALKRCFLNGLETERTLDTDLPVIIDTRLYIDQYDARVEAALQLYPDSDANDIRFGNMNLALTGEYKRNIELPYPGETFVNIGQKVNPDDLVAVNRFAPPRLYVINPFGDVVLGKNIPLRNLLMVSVGDRIEFDDPLAQPMPDSKHKKPFLSPVRGMVEYIDYQSGVIVAAEIQDYSTKPVKVNLADRMSLAPKKAAKYFSKNVGDFVYQGDNLAKRIDSSGTCFVTSPTTGEIVEFSRETSDITIVYKANPHNYLAHISADVTQVEEGRSVQLSFTGKRLEAIIGWGEPIHGKLSFVNPDQISEMDSDSIVVINGKFSNAIVEALQLQKVKAIVCPSADENDVVNYLNMEPGVINTGFEQIPASLILVQGFGDIPFSTEQVSLFNSNKGKLCYLDPATRIRAGVQRASIVFLE